MITTVASYIVIAVLSLGAFWGGAYNRVITEMAIERESLIVKIIDYDMKSLTEIEVG